MIERKHGEVLVRAIVQVHAFYPGPRMCLAQCVVLERVLKEALPVVGFSLRLGALRVRSLEGPYAIDFDPRGDEGIDGGFHAWLEDPHGLILDPSVMASLAADEAPINPAPFVLARRDILFACDGLGFTYEELASLELVDPSRSEPTLTELARWMAKRATGTAGPPYEKSEELHFDVQWKR